MKFSTYAYIVYSDPAECMACCPRKEKQQTVSFLPMALRQYNNCLSILTSGVIVLMRVEAV